MLNTPTNEVRPQENPDDVTEEILCHLRGPFKHQGITVVRADDLWGLEEAGFRVPVGNLTRGKRASLDTVQHAVRTLTTRLFVAAGLA